MKTLLRGDFFRAERSPHPIWRVIDPNLVLPPSDALPGLLALLLTPAVSFSATLVQKAPRVRPADVGSPVLIWDVDRKLAAALPRNFRTTDDPLRANNGQKIPTKTGLTNLCASGSGEFTTDGLQLLLERTRGPVTVFDLRQETHIFVNGLPISWFATNDWANVGRTHNEIEADEAARVKSLKPGSKIIVHPGAAIKKPGVTSSVPENVIVEHASTERELVETNRAAYVRLTVTDHARPLDEEVDRFILAVRTLPENGWAHFHCEAGRGRTTTFLVMYDMLRNATQVSLDDIVRRQRLIGYDYDVLRPTDMGSWKAPYTTDRIAFVRAFYKYSRANPSGRPELWCEWLKSHPN
jgi:protein-tyrosine phosphatase